MSLITKCETSFSFVIFHVENELLSRLIIQSCNETTLMSDALMVCELSHH